MIVKIFKTNQIIANIFIVILSVLLWIPAYFNVVEISFSNYSICNFFIKFLENFWWLNILFSSLMVGFQAVFLNFIINQEKLVKGNTHLVGLFYVVLNGALTLLFTINSILIANTFIITVLFLLFKLYSLNDAKSLLFNVGFLTGLATLVYSPLFCLFPLIWIVLSYVRTPSFRDYFISSLGFLLPLVYMVAYLYLTDGLFATNIIDWIYFPAIFSSDLLNQPNLYYVLVLGSFIFLSASSLMLQLSREVVKDRKLFVVLILLALFIVLTLVFSRNDFVTLYLLLSVPSSIILANYFNKLKKEWLSEVFFIIIVLGILASYFL